MVINWILDPLRVPETYCKSRAFTQYGTLFSYIGDIGNSEDWCNLRLVCREWAHFAGPRKQLHVRGPNDRLQPGLVGIRYGYYPKEVLFAQLLEVPDVSSRLTSLSLLEEDGAPRPVNTMDLFLNNSLNFPMLRSLCLRLINRSDRIHNFWVRLSQGYPLLVHLAIFDCFLPTGEVVFGDLETLIISAWGSTRFDPLENTRFCLPSLKSVAFVGWHSGLKQILLDHGSQLTSLTFALRYVSPGIIDNQLWTLVPNLLTIDIPFADVGAIGPIPIGHPLRRICIHALPDDRKKVENARQILLAFPQVSHLCLSETVLSKSTQRSIRHLASQYGMTFNAFPDKGPLDGLPWYMYLFHRSYRLRRRRDLIFFPFGMILLIIVGGTYVLVSALHFICVWLSRKVRKHMTRLYGTQS